MKFETIIQNMVLVGMIIIVVVLMVATSYARQPAVTWTPVMLEEALVPGSSKQIAISITSNRRLKNRQIVISEEFSRYISVDPMSISVRRGRTVELLATLSVPEDIQTGTKVFGTVAIARKNKQANERRKNRRSKEKHNYLSETLKISITALNKPNDDQIITDLDGRASLKIPQDWLFDQEDNYTGVYLPSRGDHLPPNIAFYTFSVPKSYSDLPSDEALMRVALLRIGISDIRTQSYFLNGLGVDARTLYRYHFYFYDPETSQAIEFSSSNENIFRSNDFNSMINSLEFQ